MAAVGLHGSWKRYASTAAAVVSRGKVSSCTPATRNGDDSAFVVGATMGGGDDGLGERARIAAKGTPNPSKGSHVIEGKVGLHFRLRYHHPIASNTHTHTRATGDTNHTGGGTVSSVTQRGWRSSI